MYLRMARDGSCDVAANLPGGAQQEVQYAFEDGNRLVLCGVEYDGNKEKLLRQPLPLPYGERLWEAPVFWRWASLSELDEKGLANALSRIVSSQIPLPSQIQLQGTLCDEEERSEPDLEYDDEEQEDPEEDEGEEEEEDSDLEGVDSDSEEEEQDVSFFVCEDGDGKNAVPDRIEIDASL